MSHTSSSWSTGALLGSWEESHTWVIICMSRCFIKNSETHSNYQGWASLSPQEDILIVNDLVNAKVFEFMPILEL